MFWFSNSRLTRLTFFITSCRCDESHFVTFFRRTVWKGKKIIKRIALLLHLRCCWLIYCKITQNDGTSLTVCPFSPRPGSHLLNSAFKSTVCLPYVSTCATQKKNQKKNPTKTRINIISSHSIWHQKYSEIPSRRYLYPARLILEQKGS